MNRNDHKAEDILAHRAKADAEHGLIGHWVSRFFPVWSDTPPYDRASASLLVSAAPSAAKR